MWDQVVLHSPDSVPLGVHDPRSWEKSPFSSIRGLAPRLGLLHGVNLVDSQTITGLVPRAVS